MLLFIGKLVILIVVIFLGGKFLSGAEKRDPATTRSPNPLRRGIYSITWVAMVTATLAWVVLTIF